MVFIKWYKAQKIIAPRLEISGRKLLVMCLDNHSNDAQRSNYRVLLHKYKLEEYLYENKKILLVDEAHPDLKSLQDDFKTIMEVEILDDEDYINIAKK